MTSDRQWEKWISPNAARSGQGRPMDPFAFPPLPAIISMQDRADGTVWYLEHRESDERFMISDVPPDEKRQLAVVRFGPFEGPWVQNDKNARIRLFIRSGRIGYELIPGGRGDRDISSSRVYTRIGMRRYALELIPSTWAKDGDVLGWKLAWSLV